MYLCREEKGTSKALNLEKALTCHLIVSMFVSVEIIYDKIFLTTLQNTPDHEKEMNEFKSQNETIVLLIFQILIQTIKIQINKVEMDVS